MNKTRPASRVSASRAYLPVDEFQSRVLSLSHTLVLRSQRALFRDVFRNSSAVTEQPLLREATRAIDALLSDRTRVYLDSVGNLTHLRADYVSAAQVAIEVNRLARRILEITAGALDDAAKAPVRYWRYVSDEPLTFEQVTHKTVTSAEYLRWTLRAGALPPRYSREMRSYLAAEVDAYGDQDHADPDWRPLYGDVKPADLPSLRSMLPPEVLEVVDLRPWDPETFWPWLWVAARDPEPWPFPSLIRPYQNAVSLQREAGLLSSLGVLLNWMPFDGIVYSEKGVRTDDPGSHACVEAWATCLDAGLALRHLSIVLRALNEPATSRHCAVCFRHVATGHRNRCERHHSSAALRARAARLERYAADFAQARLKRRQQLAGDPMFADSVREISRCWVELSSTGNSVDSSHAAMNAARLMASGEQVEMLARGLELMVHRLGPVAGPVLHQRMERLKDAVVAHVLSQCPPLGQNPPAQEISDRHLLMLLPAGFFALWFAGLPEGFPESDLRVGTDLGHPLARALLASVRISRPTPGIPSVCDLQSVVADLVSHRAWLDVGGASADSALDEGAPVPSDIARKTVDLVEARRLRFDEKLSFRAIAERLGVTAAGVLLALRRDAGASEGGADLASARPAKGLKRRPRPSKNR